MIPDPQAISLQHPAFVQYKPQNFQHGHSLTLQSLPPFTDPDRGHHAEGDGPGDHSRAKNGVSILSCPFPPSLILATEGLPILISLPTISPTTFLNPTHHLRCGFGDKTRDPPLLRVQVKPSLFCPQHKFWLRSPVHVLHSRCLHLERVQTHRRAVRPESAHPRPETRNLKRRSVILTHISWNIVENIALKEEVATGFEKMASAFNRIDARPGPELTVKPSSSPSQSFAAAQRAQTFPRSTPPKNTMSRSKKHLMIRSGLQNQKPDLVSFEADARRLMASCSSYGVDLVGSLCSMSSWLA